MNTIPVFGIVIFSVVGLLIVLFWLIGALSAIVAAKAGRSLARRRHMGWRVEQDGPQEPDEYDSPANTPLPAAALADQPPAGSKTFVAANDYDDRFNRFE